MAFFSMQVAFLLTMTLANGGGPIEFGQLIDPADYFASRNIKTTPENLLALATKPPTSAKEGFQQLLAIRWLADNKGKMGSSKEAVRQVLKQLIDAQDETVKEYARASQAKIDGKAADGRTIPKNSVRFEALEWLPREVTFAGAVDLRMPSGIGSGGEGDKLHQRFQAEFRKLISKPFKDQIYLFAETVGNIRINRVAFGFAPNPTPGGKERDHLYIRLTGKVNHTRIVEFSKQMNDFKRVEFVEKKGPKGEPITILAMPYIPMLILIGDTDLLIYSFNREEVEKLIENTLKTQAGQGQGATHGPLARLLKDVPPDAVGFVAGNMTEALREEFGPLKYEIPRHLIVTLMPATSGKTGVELTLQATTLRRADARKFVDTTKSTIKSGNDRINDPPPFIPEDLMKVMMHMLDGFELRADGTKVRATLPVSAETQERLIPMLMRATGAF